MDIICGIYKIEDVANGDVYIGGANNIKKRWSNHLSRLRKNKYSYIELQDAYNTNKNSVKFEVLEECPEELLKEREEYWINYCSHVDGWHVLNKQKKGKRHTVADTSKMCLAQRGENNGHCCKLDTENVKQIKILLNNGTRQSQIAKRFGVSQTLVYNISIGKRWASVQLIN